MHVHFVGIGGIGMSGIARILVELGYDVSGSDLRESAITKKLQEKGIQFYLGHASSNIAGADLIVVSSAVSPENAEVLEARSKNVPVLQRAEMLAYLMQTRYGIAVAGTHGKTTTTSMVATILERSGRDPTVVIGGELTELGQNAKLGKSSFLVAEADESDASFLKLSPKIAVVTNIDTDVNPSLGPFASHQFDYEKTLNQIREVFLEFLQHVPSDGYAILCLDNPHLRKILKLLSCHVLTYGFSPEADLVASDVKLHEHQSWFKVYFKGECWGEVLISVPGRHNILNALASIGAVLQVGVSFEEAKNGLAAFQGVKRRFQILGEVDEILVVDDYAHNPTKIKATLSAAKEGWHRRTIAVFQPHRFTRTKFLLQEFADAFEDADVLLVTEIYAAGETPIQGISGRSLMQQIKSKHPEKQIYFLETQEEVLKKLFEIIQPHDMVLTLGAGDIHWVGTKFFEKLNLLKAQNAS